MADKTTKTDSGSNDSQDRAKPASSAVSQSFQAQQSSSKGTVQLTNRTNRTVELDFGRDEEIRIRSRESATMDKKYLKHPAFLREKGNLLVR